MSYRQRHFRPARRYYSRNRFLAKKTAFQLLKIVGQLALILGKIIAGVFVLAGLLGRPLTRLLVKIIILPLYRLLKRLIAKSIAYKTYWQNQFGENFSRNVVIYGGLSLLSLLATVTNLKAREARPEEVGRQSGLYVLLVEESDAGLVEEKAAEEPFERPSKDANQDLAAVSAPSQNQPAAAGAEEEPRELSLLTQSGDALIKPDLSGRELPAERREQIITYTVAEGDTISEIADRFDVSTNTILWENKLGRRDFIKPGQQLVILPVTGVSHLVGGGDTVDKIAARYQAKSEDILEINKLAAGATLRLGEKIIVPDGIPPAAPRRAVALVRPRPLANIGNIFKRAPEIIGGLNWPTISRRISQYFRGWRHTGLDIPASTGQPIYAADDGLVITSGWSRGGYGRYIVVDHGNGLETLYGHNSQNFVAAGERVEAGQVIAAIGSTGRSTGPHVHFEVRVDGNRVNPLDYL